MTWILGFSAAFFTLLSSGLLLKNTQQKKNICWLLGLLMVLTLLFYMHLGHPSLPDHPYKKIQALSTPKNILKAFDQIVIQQELVQQEPLNDKAWFELGTLYQKIKQFYKAALVYREAWKLKQNNYEYKFAYTKALIFFNDLNLSAITLKLLKELHQENPKDERVTRFIRLMKKPKNVE
jgi:cytochrome c-type biogenesis protein CcmH/NrfG